MLDFKMVENLKPIGVGKVYAVVGGLRGSGLFGKWETCGAMGASCQFKKFELNVRSSGGTKYTSYEEMEKAVFAWLTEHGGDDDAEMVQQHLEERAAQKAEAEAAARAAAEDKAQRRAQAKAQAEERARDAARQAKGLEEKTQRMREEVRLRQAAQQR